MLDEIRAILSDPGVLGDDAWNVGDDVDLRSFGLGSMQMVQILVEIEERFGIEIPDEKLVPETFSTIDSIVAAVASVRVSVTRVDVDPIGKEVEGVTAGSGGLTVMTDRQTHASGVLLTPREDERVYTGLRAKLGETFSDEAEEHYTAPPVIARSISERAGYARSFPQLLGAVHGAPDGGSPVPTDLVLTSAACHHLYPLLASRATGGCLSVEAMCYRGEATAETGRLRSFRMYEVLRYGPETVVEEWRGQALTTAEQLLRILGLDVEPCAANDPFFGRIGKYLASAQQSEQLKWELVATVEDGIEQAVASVNYHMEHFGDAFGLRLPDGAVVHSACVAFGLDRILLALRHQHGQRADGWPASIRAVLGL